MNSSDALFCFTLSNAYQRVGMKDSAAYYLEKGKELQKKEKYAKVSVLVESKPEEMIGERLALWNKGMQQKEKLKLHERNERWACAGLIGLFVSLIVWTVFYIRKSRRYQASEEKRTILESEHQQLVEQWIQVEEQLTKQDVLLQEQGVLLERKEEQIQLLQQRLDDFSVDNVDILDKVNRIITDFKYKEESD